MGSIVSSPAGFGAEPQPTNDLVYLLCRFVLLSNIFFWNTEWSKVNEV